MDKILWDLFKKTGDMKYFLMLKRLNNLEGEKNGVKENRGNSNK